MIPHILRDPKAFSTHIVLLFFRFKLTKPKRTYAPWRNAALIKFCLAILIFVSDGIIHPINKHLYVNRSLTCSLLTVFKLAIASGMLSCDTCIRMVSNDIIDRLSYIWRQRHSVDVSFLPVIMIIIITLPDERKNTKIIIGLLGVSDEELNARNTFNAVNSLAMYTRVVFVKTLRLHSLRR